MPSLVDHWWARPNPGRNDTVLESALRHFSNTGLGILHNSPMPLSWAVEHAAEFARAWKASSDAPAMISLAARVMSERDYVRLVAKIARLALPYTYDDRTKAAVAVVERWADGHASLDAVREAHKDVLQAGQELADYTPEKMAASAAYWLTNIPQDRERIDVGYFEGRSVVRAVREAAVAGNDFYPNTRGQITAKQIDGKVAAIIRRELKLKLTDVVMASRR